MRESPCFMKHRGWYINLEQITAVYYGEHEDKKNELIAFCDVYLTMGDEKDDPYFSFFGDEADLFFQNFKSAIQWRKP